MHSSLPIFALAGLGDVPGWMFIVMFSIWPFHVANALLSSPGLDLVGHGPAATAAQAIVLVAFLLAFSIILRAHRIRRVFKWLYLPVGYPVLTFLTNLGPAWISYALHKGAA